MQTNVDLRESNSAPSGWFKLTIYRFSKIRDIAIHLLLPYKHRKIKMKDLVTYPSYELTMIPFKVQRMTWRMSLLSTSKHRKVQSKCRLAPIRIWYFPTSNAAWMKTKKFKAQKEFRTSLDKLSIASTVGFLVSDGCIKLLWWNLSTNFSFKKSLNWKRSLQAPKHWNVNWVSKKNAKSPRWTHKHFNRVKVSLLPESPARWMGETLWNYWEEIDCAQATDTDFRADPQIFESRFMSAVLSVTACKVAVNHIKFSSRLKYDSIMSEDYIIQFLVEFVQLFSNKSRPFLKTHAIKYFTFQTTLLYFNV